MASAFISSPAEIVVIDSRVRPGTITLPVTNSIPYRVVSFKDQYGSFSNSTLTLSTQIGESFDDGTTSKTFSNAFTSLSLYATSSKWMVMNATQTVQQTISSLIVNQLIFGSGAGWVQFGPVQASVVSSIQEQTQTAYINNLYLGNLSTLNTIQYNGLFSNYNNTVLAEVSTGAGTQELLFFKGSSVSDRFRFQTTGNFVVETGVSARLFSTTTLPTLSNITPAFIVNTSSNVGIQTATPQTALDVAGTGRFQQVSTLALILSSINGQVYSSGGGSSGPVPFISAFTVSTGTVNASTISTASLFVNTGIFSSIATNSLSAATIIVSTMSTNIANVSLRLTASSLVVNGTGLLSFNGTNSASLYGITNDTLTLQTSSNSYSGGIASLAFATNSASYPLARIYAVDSALSGSAVSQLIFQNVPVSATTFTSNYSYTGSGQTLTIPSGVTTIQVTMWSAGGSGGSGVGAVGGAGTFIRGTLSVTPGQVFTIMVGQGGVYNSITSTYGGGGGTGAAGGNTGSGGGRSAIQITLSATSATGSGSAVTYTTSTAHGLQVGQPITITGFSPSGFNGSFVVASISPPTQFSVVSTQSGSSTGTGTIVADVLNIGGGGAGPQNAATVSGGPGAFSGTAFAAPGGFGGGGGTQTGGGAAGGGGSAPTPTAGSLLQGGVGGGAGGGGGGGYYGGGGGGWTAAVGNGGGGGGSSYIANTLFGLQVGSNSPNSANQAPATTSPLYQAGVAAGGGTTSAGGNGYVVINSLGGSITEAMRIASNGYIGVATATPAYQLDVAGIGRLSNLYLGTNSTLATQQFYGLFGAYNNTVLAEVSTGGGTQELLIFKGSSSSDRVRVQTTGNFVVETGVTSRLWASNGLSTLSNVTPALIVNASSNVGIQTATPQTALDVAGTGRFITLSSFAIYTSSIVAPYTFAPQYFTF